MPLCVTLSDGYLDVARHDRNLQRLRPHQHRPLGHPRRGLAFGHDDIVGAATHQIIDLIV